MSGRYTARRIDGETARYDRRFRELEARVDDLNVGTLSAVPGSVVDIDVVLTDPTSLVNFKIDEFTTTGPGDITLTLTYIPIRDSVHIYVNGIEQGLDWTLSLNVVTLLDPDDELLADDEVFVKYAYMPSVATPPPPGPPFIELVGITTGTDNISSLALPAGTQDGDLMVLTAAGHTSASSADSRLTGDAGVAGVNCLVKWGLADSSGTAVSVSVNASAFLWGAAILAVYRGVDVSDFDISYAVASPTSFPTFPDAYAAIGVITARSGFTAGDISNPLDTTLEFTSDAVLNDTKVHVGVASWDSPVEFTSPAGNVTKSADIAELIAVTLLLESTL